MSLYNVTCKTIPFNIMSLYNRTTISDSSQKTEASAWAILIINHSQLIIKRNLSKLCANVNKAGAP